MSLCSKAFCGSTLHSSYSNPISSHSKLKFFTTRYNNYKDPRTWTPVSFIVWPCPIGVPLLSPLLQPLASCCSGDTLGTPPTSGPLCAFPFSRTFLRRYLHSFLPNLCRSLLHHHFLREAFPDLLSYRRYQRSSTIFSQRVKESGDPFVFLNLVLHLTTFASYCSRIPQISIQSLLPQKNIE